MDMQGSRGKARSPTAKRRLHDGSPLWSASRGRHVQSLRRPSATHWDVIVVGTGISGALVAEALADGTRRVLILDRRRPVEGSTLASTAMIQHEIDVPLHRLARMIGAEKAARAWRRSALAVEALRLRAERLGLACGMEAKCALYLSGDDCGARALAMETAARHRAGLPAEYLSAAALRERFGIARTAAIVTPLSASANPAQLAAGLIRAARSRGAEVASPVEITDLAETGDAVALATAQGRILTAAQVVFCTGYEFLKCMESPAHRVISTWAVASRPGVARPGWLDAFLVWEASDPYLYFRTDPRGRIIAGGEDEDDPNAHADADKSRRKHAAIAAKLRDLTGIDIGAPAFAWAAPFGNTTTGLPIIDLVPGCSRVQAVMGFGGNGITYSVIASQVVSAAIRGRPDPDADLYRP